VLFRSVSNRLLEALYYGRPILTNSTAKLLYNKLEHLHHIFISDDYKDYPTIVRVLLKMIRYLKNLAWELRRLISTTSQQEDTVY